MALVFVGYDYNGQPIFENDGGPISPTPNTDPRAMTTGSPTYSTGGAGGSSGANSTIDPNTGRPRPVSAPNVPSSTLIPGTNTPRPVDVPYNPIPEDQRIADDWTRNQGNLDNAYEQWGRGTIATMQGDQAYWESQVGGLVNQLPGITNQQNAARTGNTATYADALRGYQASDEAALGTYTGANNAALGIYNQRANDLYNTSVPMLSASQWSSNPQDIANQQQALGQFGDIYGGSLDYQAAQAQAAQAQAVMAQLYQYASDPSDVNRQKQAIEQLGGLINGGEWNENLRGVTQKYKDLSNPEITAQEKFILENFKQRREDLERNNREAVMSNLAARGMRSGAAEQTAMLNSQQEMGRQSVLNDLGAQANAIGRSQQAMAGWSQASQAGRAAQLQASGMYVDAAGNLRKMNDDVGLANTGWANQNSIVNAGQQSETNRYNAGLQTQTNISNAGFQNDAYARNQATRMAGAQGYGTQANAIREANDYVGTFNTGQSNLVNMQNQRVTLEDLQRQGDLANTQLSNNSAINNNNFWGTTGVNAAGAQRAGAIQSTQQADIDSFAGNQRGDVGTQIGFQDATLAGRNAVTGATQGLGSSLYGPTGVFTGTLAGTTGAALSLNKRKYQLDQGQDIYG